MQPKPKKTEEPDYGFLEDETHKKRKERRTYLIVTLLNSLLLYTLYVVLTQFEFWMIVTSVYMIALAIVSFGYVFYNRGFTRKNVTVDMLPEGWSEEEKTEYIEDAKRREKKSKWCLTILFPLIFTFLMDILYLYIYIPHIEPLLGSLFT